MSKLKKINDFNSFATTHLFYSSRTGLADQPYLLDIDGQIQVNLKCEASYQQLVAAWNRYQKGD